MDYQLDLKVPAKYFGDEVSGQLAKLGDDQIKNMNVDLPVSITGAISKPSIKVNMKQAVTNLTNQIIQAQKDKLKDKATDEVKDKLNDLLGGDKDDDKDKDKKDEKDQLKDQAESLIDGLLGGKKKKKK